MTATEKLSQIISILGNPDTDPARLAVAAYKLGATLSSGSPTITKTDARRIAGAHVADKEDLDSILSALTSARLISVETQSSDKPGRPQVLISSL